MISEDSLTHLEDLTAAMDTVPDVAAVVSARDIDSNLWEIAEALIGESWDAAAPSLEGK